MRRFSLLGLLVAAGLVVPAAASAATTPPVPAPGYTWVKSSAGGASAGALVLRPPATIPCGGSLQAGVVTAGASRRSSMILANASTTRGTAGFFNHNFNPRTRGVQLRNPPELLQGPACNGTRYLQYIFESGSRRLKRAVVTYTFKVSAPANQPAPPPPPAGYGFVTSMQSNASQGVGILTPPASVPCGSGVTAGLDMGTIAPRVGQVFSYVGAAPGSGQFPGEPVFGDTFEFTNQNGIEYSPSLAVPQSACGTTVYLTYQFQGQGLSGSRSKRATLTYPVAVAPAA